MVFQNFMQIPELSIIDNILLGNKTGKALINYKKAEVKIVALLEKFGMKVSPYTLIKNLSVGERQRIEIVKTIYFGAKILILDEPTAVLTPQETEELFLIIDQLKKDGCAIVFISHKLREVITVGDRITVMRKGRVVESSIMRGEIDETGVAKAMIGKADVQLVKNNRKQKIGKEILKVENLWYFDKLGIPKIRNLSFKIHKGEILGVGGVEGNGQTELIQLLIGLLNPCRGSVILENQHLEHSSVATYRMVLWKRISLPVERLHLNFQTVFCLKIGRSKDILRK